ncbi:hypothetical protein [Bacillus sp. NPDC094106]|uniref:hypothetical protein n=1 Tax=Bacillus sp. NPDC094106 TaxID=3363949 RepID=UPI0037F85A25
MDELVRKCVDDSLKKQRGLETGDIYFGMGPHLIDDENRIVTVINTKKRSLSVQIINKYVVNVIGVLRDIDKTSVLKVNFEELRHIFTKLYFFFNRTVAKEKNQAVPKGH